LVNYDDSKTNKFLSAQQLNNACLRSWKYNDWKEGWEVFCDLIKLSVLNMKINLLSMRQLWKKVSLF